MRFGIMAMQIQNIIPKELSQDEVLPHLMEYDQSKVINHLANHGFNPIEIGGDLRMFLPNTFTLSKIEKLKQLKSDLGIQYTVHLPLWSVEPSTPLEPVRQGSRAALVDFINATQLLEPEVYVLHATGALVAEFYRMHFSEATKSLILRQFQSNALKSIDEILTHTKLPSRLLAVETVEFPFALTLEIAEKLDLSICLDTGHVLSGFCGAYDLFEVLERSYSRLTEIHLHDAPRQTDPQNIRYGLDHRPLGKGDLDLSRLINYLNENNFIGPLIFELRLDEALQSLDEIRTLGYTI
jgi:sugar phosphate isomerase/epimerase